MNIYCDGACWPRNPADAIGWGVYCEHSKQKFSDGIYHRSTNQQAEILALIAALFVAQSGDKIFSDSRYALLMARVKPTYNVNKINANRFLVSVLREVRWSKPGVRLAWVKGHSGIYGNEMADSLAEAAAKNVAHKSLNHTSYVASPPRDNGQRIESPASA